MKTRAAKTQEKKSQSVTNAVSRKLDSESASQFFDNRPEAAAQGKLKEMANNSSQVKQLRTIQEMADNGSHDEQAAQLQVIANKSEIVQMAREGMRARIRAKILNNQALTPREAKKAAQYGIQIPQPQPQAQPQPAPQPQPPPPPPPPPQPQPVLNAAAQPFVPQQQPPQPQPQPQALNAHAAPFVPQQQALNAHAQPFVPQQQPAPQPQALFYPNIAHGTPVNPNLLNQITNLPQGQHQIIGQWHLGFEIWANAHGFNNGNVAHFNVQAPMGPMLHVYFNAMGQLEIVPSGQRPQGF